MKLPKFDSWPFVLRMVWDPVRALDLRDSKNNPDHGKIVPWLTLMFVLVLKVFAITFTALEMTVLFTASFGYGMWRTFLKTKTLTGNVNVQESVSVAVSKAFHEFKADIEARIRGVPARDPELGVQPTVE